MRHRRRHHQDALAPHHDQLRLRRTLTSATNCRMHEQESERTSALNSSSSSSEKSSSSAGMALQARRPCYKTAQCIPLPLLPSTSRGSNDDTDLSVHSESKQCQAFLASSIVLRPEQVS